MAWIKVHKNAGRAAVLLLLLLAVGGPWAYSRDGVPPAEWCREPFLLLDGSRCVRLVPGAEILSFMPAAFLSVAAQIATNLSSLTGRWRELTGTFLISLLVLPYLSTLLLVWRGDRRSLQSFHMAACGLAALLGLLLLADPLGRGGLAWATTISLFWGLWLYIGSVAASSAWEAMRLLTRYRRRVS